MRVSKILITILITTIPISVYSQDSSINQNKKDESQKNIVTVQKENNNKNEFAPQIKNPNDVVLTKDVEIKNLSTSSEKDKTVFGLKHSEWRIFGVTVLVLCIFIFGVVRYLLTKKQ